jgi:hypothetical protein
MIAMIVSPGLETDTDLAQVAQALSLPPLAQAALNGRQKQSRENDDDADDEQQFQQGEAGPFPLLGRFWFNAPKHIAMCSGAGKSSISSATDKDLTSE